MKKDLVFEVPARRRLHHVLAKHATSKYGLDELYFDGDKHLIATNAKAAVCVTVNLKDVDAPPRPFTVNKDAAKAISTGNSIKQITVDYEQECMEICALTRGRTTWRFSIDVNPHFPENWQDWIPEQPEYDTVSIGLNAKYLHRISQAMNAEDLVLQIPQDPVARPIVIRPVDDPNGDRLASLMPIVLD